MIETGKILSLISDSNLLFQGSKEKLVINNYNKFGNLEIGKVVSAIIIPFFYGLSYFKNINGKYKLISIEAGKRKTGLYFKIKNTEEIILVVLDLNDNSFNNLILGDYFDLDIIPSYKGFNYFKNIPENKNCLNEEVIILNIIDDTHFLALRNKETIIISADKKVDAYIGESILITLYRAVGSQNIQIGSNFSKGFINNFTFDLTTGFSKYITLNNEDLILNNRTIVSSNNTGKNLSVNFIPIKYGSYTSFKESKDKNSGYELLGINQSFNDNVGSEHIFRDVAKKDKIFACYFIQPLDLNNKLGSVFTFINTDYYKLFNILNTSRIDNGEYLLLEIIPNANVKLFIKNNIKYAINCENFTISDSLLGCYFTLEIKKYIYGDIIDVN
jgi:hypothetical protein